MNQRRQHGKSLRRKVAYRAELRTVVVFCEGKNSEPDYIRGLKRLPEVSEGAAVNLELHPQHGMPHQLVALAGQRLTDPEVDQCWCVFDVEWPQNHPDLLAAVELARATGVRLAISNPCFELWLILHHEDLQRFVDTDKAERHSRKLDGRCGKSVDAARYMPLRWAAVRRAELLEQRHRRNHVTFPQDNPSSGMHHFLTALERA